MKKFRLSFLLLSLLLVAVGARADEITVNDGEVTNATVPFYGYWADAFNRSQFIIPAENVKDMAKNYITKMSFYAVSDASWGNAIVKIYLSEVKEDAFDAEAIEAYDWANLTEVYEGAISVVDGVMAVELDEPYEYKGGNLLVAFSQTVKGSYKSVTWRGVEATAAAISGYNSSSPEEISYTIRNFLPETTFEYAATASTCKKPKDLTVSDVTTTSAKVSWTSEADNWQVEYTAANGTTNSFYVSDPYVTLNGNAGDILTVKVRSVCDATSSSDWVETVVAFEACEDEDKCAITYELEDGLGYGWLGTHLDVVDHLSGNVIATLSYDDATTGIVPVCPGQLIDIVLVSGGSGFDSYIVGYNIYDVSGEAIAKHGAGNTFTPGVQATYLVDCTVETDCLTPVDLAYSDVTAHTATLSWTEKGTSTSWTIMYMAENDQDVSFADANENPFTLTELQPETTYYALVYPTCDENKQSDAISFTTPPACVMPTDIEVTPVATTAEISWTGYSDSYVLRYKPVTEPTFFDGFENGLDQWTTLRNGEGNSNTDWSVYNPTNFQEPIPAYEGNNVAMSRSWASSGYNVDNWLISPEVTLDGTLKFWVMDDGMYHEHYDIYVSNTGKEIADFGNEPFFSPGNASGTWAEISVDLSGFKGQKGYIAIRHTDYDQDFLLIDNFGIYPAEAEAEWTTINTTDESVVIDGLTPETTYEYQLEGVCEEANSKTLSGKFTTLEACPVPFNITVKPDVTTATVTWKGESESYVVRYRKPASAEKLFFEDFESGLGDWTTYDVDGDGNNWYVTQNGSDDNNGNPRGFDAYHATSASYVNNTGALYPDNWLVSPEVELQGTLSVWLRGQDPNWAGEHFAVYVSTEGKTVENFLADEANCVIPETVAQNILTEYTADLSGFKGQKGYIAIRHFNISDMFMLNLDNVALLGDEVEATEWQEVTTDETTAELTGLEPGTEYELQVQGVCDKQPTEWSNTVLFTTATSLELLDDDSEMEEGAKNTDLLIAMKGKPANVTLKDRVFYKDGNWNTLCLPFNLTEEEIAESPLAGAKICELYYAKVEGTHVDITFSPATEISSDWFYIFKWEEQGENIVDPVFNGVTIDFSDPEGPMINTTDFKFWVMGNYSTVVADPSKDEVYAYYLGADNKLRYSEEPVNLHTFRLYFNFFKSDVDPSAVEFNLNFDGEESTGIVEVDGARKAAHEGTYNLQGVKINEPKQKGVYIQNGRKVVVK